MEAVRRGHDQVGVRQEERVPFPCALKGISRSQWLAPRTLEDTVNAPIGTVGRDTSWSGQSLIAAEASHANTVTPAAAVHRKCYHKVRRVEGESVLTTRTISHGLTVSFNLHSLSKRHPCVRPTPDDLETGEPDVDGFDPSDGVCVPMSDGWISEKYPPGEAATLGGQNSNRYR